MPMNAGIPEELQPVRAVLVTALAAFRTDQSQENRAVLEDAAAQYAVGVAELRLKLAEGARPGWLDALRAEAAAWREVSSTNRGEVAKLAEEGKLLDRAATDVNEEIYATDNYLLTQAAAEVAKGASKRQYAGKGYGPHPFDQVFSPHQRRDWTVDIYEKEVKILDGLANRAPSENFSPVGQTRDGGIGQTRRRGRRASTIVNNGNVTTLNPNPGGAAYIGSMGGAGKVHGTPPPDAVVADTFGTTENSPTTSSPADRTRPDGSDGRAERGSPEPASPDPTSDGQAKYIVTQGWGATGRVAASRPGESGSFSTTTPDGTRIHASGYVPKAPTQPPRTGPKPPHGAPDNGDPASPKRPRAV